MRKHSPETIEKIRQSQIGRKFTPEHREKLRQAHLGVPLSPKHRAGVIKTLRHPRKGGTYEEAYGPEIAKRMKEKMRQAKLGKKMPWNSVPDRIGEKSPRWKGGTSRAYKTGYYSLEYKAWRKKVFERDNFTCRGCGFSKGYLTAHHIKSFAHYSELRYELSNGLTLCESCHSKTDNYKGRGIRKSKSLVR